MAGWAPGFPAARGPPPARPPAPALPGAGLLRGAGGGAARGPPGGAAVRPAPAAWAGRGRGRWRPGPGGERLRAGRPGPNAAPSGVGAHPSQTKARSAGIPEKAFVLLPSPSVPTPPLQKAQFRLKLFSIRSGIRENARCVSNGTGTGLRPLPGGAFEIAGVFFPSFSFNRTFPMLLWQSIREGIVEGVEISRANISHKEYLCLSGSESTKRGFFSREIMCFEQKSPAEDWL